MKQKLIIIISLLMLVFAGCDFTQNSQQDSISGVGLGNDTEEMAELSRAGTLPDLVISVAGPNSTRVNQGEAISFYYTLRNIGAEGVGTSTFDVAVFLSVNFYLDGTDIELSGAYRVCSYHLSTGWYQTINVTAVIPQTVPDQKYFLIGVVDVRPNMPPNYYPGVQESNETNNRNLSATNFAIGNYYEIGDTGPAGGKIFYDKGSYSDGWRWMEAAPANTCFRSPWSEVPVNTGVQSTSVGAGLTNTNTIYALCSPLYYMYGFDFAAIKCYLFTYNGYGDWFLPSKDELYWMQENLFIACWDCGNYWSSSEYNMLVEKAWILPWNYSGYLTQQTKTYQYNWVRPARRF